MKTPGEFRTRVIQDGVHPSLHIDYKSFSSTSRKARAAGRKKRSATPTTLAANKGLSNLPYLQRIGRENQSALTDVRAYDVGASGTLAYFAYPGACCEAAAIPKKTKQI
jgi:hypothetical protein